MLDGMFYFSTEGLFKGHLNILSTQLFHPTIPLIHSTYFTPQIRKFKYKCFIFLNFITMKHNTAVKGGTHPLISIIVVSLLLRIVPIVILSMNESIANHQLMATDIDYKVYTDAARYDSPYERHTYRYSPLLAYMMIPNTYLQCFGKLVFCCWDVVAIVLLWLLTKQQHGSGTAQLICKLYGFNPLFVYLTVRGSCESVTLALMYGFNYLLFKHPLSGNQRPTERKPEMESPSPLRRFCCYAVYGLWVHFRVYPIVFLPLLLSHQYQCYCRKSKMTLLKKVVEIGVIAGGVFLLLAAIFYLLYGYQFLEQTYLYHLTRKDHRHSFSPFFYELYLNFQTESENGIRNLFRLFPQLYLILTLLYVHSRTQSFFSVQFFVTFGFVEFNRVITMQYYMWVWGALLLLLPESRIVSMGMLRKGFNLTMQWVLGIAVWVWLSGRLEIVGENRFDFMWFVCIVKILFDIWVLYGFIWTLNRPNPKEIERRKLEEAKRLLVKEKKNK